MGAKEVRIFLCLFGQFYVNYTLITTHQRFLNLIAIKCHFGDSVGEHPILNGLLERLPVDFAIDRPIFAHNYCIKALYSSIVNN